MYNEILKGMQMQFHSPVILWQKSYLYKSSYLYVEHQRAGPEWCWCEITHWAAENPRCSEIPVRAVRFRKSWCECNTFYEPEAVHSSWENIDQDSQQFISYCPELLFRMESQKGVTKRKRKPVIFMNQELTGSCFSHAFVSCLHSFARKTTLSLS